MDELHQRAGSGRRFPVIELNGNVQWTRCSTENRLVQDWTETGEIPPRCPRCGSQLRPDVVWFGELLLQYALEAARKAAQECEVFFSIGTSNLVEPAASLPFLALEASECVLEINPNSTPLTPHASYVLNGPAGEILPALVQAVWENESTS